MRRRLPGHLDRWPGPGEHHAVRPQLGPTGQVEPPPVPHRLQTLDLRRDHLGSRFGGGVAQVEAPLPVGGTEPAAIDPVGVDTLLDQVPLKAKTGHRRGDRGRGIAPAVRVGETDVLLRWRAQRQQAGGVALPAGPVPGHRPGVDEHHPGRVQAGRGQGPRLDGDGDALRARARHGQRRHTREDNLRPPAATVSVGVLAELGDLGPVGLAVEADPDPAAAADVRGAEDPVRLGRDQLGLGAGRGGAPQVRELVLVVALGPQGDERFLVPDVPGRRAVAGPLGDLGQRQADAPQPLGQLARPLIRRSSGRSPG